MPVSILVDDVFLDESVAFAEFVVRLDAPSTEQVTVRWATDAYTANLNDFTDSGGRLTFAAGETVKTVRVPITNDGVKEGTEAFTFYLLDPTNAVIARPVALATLTDNDATPGRPVVSIGDLVVDEADATATFVVTLDRPAAGTVSMTYATQNGSAAAGQDFRATSGRLDFKAGETAKVVKVALVNDRTLEGAESFNLVLSNLVGATSLDPVGTAVIALSDRPAVQTPNLLVDDVYLDESTTFAEFVVRLDAPSTEQVTVRWATDAYTANLNDFVDSGGRLTFAAGETVKTVRVPITNDGVKEGTEAFTFYLLDPINAVIARPVALATLTDNDAAPGRPVVSIGDLVVDEADATATFVVTLDRPAAETVSMTYATQNGSAAAGQDFRATSGRLDFKAGETAKVVKVALVNDRTLEGAENFNLVLSNLVGATSLDPVGTAVIALSDRPAVQTPNLLVDDVYLDESATFAEFVVRLDAPSTEQVTVRWATDAYTANLDDFVDSGGRLTFAAGETVKTVRVPITNDGGAEGTEAFAFYLLDPTNAGMTRSAALATIIDNDSATPSRPTITGTDADDVLFGTAGSDKIDGGRGSDVLSGGSGADYLSGGFGNDLYLVDNLRDWVSERANAGSDTVQASVSFSLSAQVEALLLVGGAAISGTGNGLANRIAGNDAANVLDGREGADRLSGGGGADTFVFSTALTANVDAVLDFAVEDSIQLSKSVFSVLVAGKLSASAFKETSAGGAVDADDRILYNKATGTLSYDADGSGKAAAAVQFAVLDNRAALTVQDFLVV